MSGVVLDLALFPLNTVVFPGSEIPIHIFEPRYRVMINRCLKEHEAFGIVLIREGREVGGNAQPHSVGTVVSISDVQRLDDGRMNIEVLGVERFRLIELIQERPYLIGRVELLRDQATESGELTGLSDTVVRYLRDYVEWLERISQREIDEFSPPSEPESLCWYVATLLPLSLAERQQILELDQIADRLRALIDILRRERLFLSQFGAFSNDDRNKLEFRQRQSFN